MLRKILSNNYVRDLVRAGCRYCSNHGKSSNIGLPKSETVLSSKSITKLSLSEPVPWLPRPVYAEPSEITQETKVTKLSNGLRVASEPKFGNFCTVGVLLDSGSRYEVAFPSGISHFLEKLAFGNTQNMSRESIMSNFEKMGGICDCQSSRDTLIYATSVDTRGLQKAIEMLGEVVLRPNITEQEISDAKMAVSFDLESLNLRPEKDLVLMEMIHAAAYRDNTLGLPKICPVANVNSIDREAIYTYMKGCHSPDRMVLAGVGVNHDLLVEYAQKYFVERPAIWENEAASFVKKNTSADKSYAQYTGGLVQEEADLSEVSLGPNPLPELAHLVVGLESFGHQHPDFVTCCVLNMIMGGGGSFSAGGPGKGMYTRLYTNVLNRYHWMHNATALNHAYVDSGLFCIHASSHPSQLGELAQVVTRELVAMASHLDQVEFQRAKVQLQSMLLMNLESRPVVFEDVGRQVLATGKRLQPEHFMEQIQNVTPDDVVRVAAQMLKSKPSVAALGSLRHLPPLEDIESALLDKNGKLPSKSRFTLFR